MANVNEQKEVKGQKKVLRRGIASARGTARLKFSHELAKQNGLFIAHLDDVSVSNITISEESTGMPSFNGMEIPKLVLTFASNEEDVNKRHYVTLQFTPVESNVKTIPGGDDAWKIDSIFDWLKHILNVYILKGRELTDEEANALSLNYTDFDEKGEYVPVEPEEVISAWKSLFENFENIMNRGREDQSYYKTKDGKNIAVWIKLLRYVKNNKKGWSAINRGDLSFPTFVGEGCIELYKQNTVASIRINSVKESIVPMNIPEAKAPNMAINNSGIPSVMGGVPVGDTMVSNGTDGIATQAMEDMPF